MGRNGRKKRMGEKMDLIVTRDRMRGGEQAITIFGHTFARVLQNLFFFHNFTFTHFTFTLFLSFRDIVFHILFL